MPDRYDAMFYIGLTIFIFGIFLGAVDISLFTIPIIGNLISTYAIYLDFKNKPKTGLGTAGNVIAIMWIILAWFIIVMLISMLSSM